jgi:glutathionyl-hydroquinone reductase
VGQEDPNDREQRELSIFNIAFNDFLSPAQASLDFYPENLRAEIDKLNEWIYPNINSKTATLAFGLNDLYVHPSRLDCVYRSGFATI